MNILRRNKVILILFLITLASRVFLVLTARGIATDGCAYGWLAKDIAGGNFHEAFDSILPPLYPLFMAGASYIFRDFELSGRVISCIFGSLTVFPLFFLIKTIFDRKIAFMTVLFFIVHPYLSQACGEVLTEALYFFFITSIVALCWVGIRRRKSALFLIVGLLLFLASLTRSEGIALIILVLGWIWFTGLPKIRSEIHFKFISSAFCLITFISVLLPYLFFIHQKTEKWQMSSRHERSVNILLRSAEDNQIHLQNVWSNLKYRFSTNVPPIPFLLIKAYHPVFLLLLFFGVIGRKRFKGFKIGEAYILTFILFRITMLVVFAGITDRYFYAFVPMALCWAAAGFWEIDYRLQEAFKGQSLSIAGSRINRFSIIILVIIMAVCLPRGLRPIRGHRAIQREIGYWLKENAGQKEFIVVAPSPQEAFYAGAKWYKLEGKTYAEVINNARQKEVDFMIINKSIDEICPDFKDYVGTDDLEIFTKKFEKSSKRIVIYKMKK